MTSVQRRQQSLNYATGSLRGNIVNIYIHGTAIISLITLFFGLLASGSLDTAIQVVLDFYIAKLLPWPVDELYLAQTIVELVISHGVTVGVGTISATFNYWRAI